jgi:hypothetical protein
MQSSLSFAGTIVSGAKHFPIRTQDRGILLRIFIVAYFYVAYYSFAFIILANLCVKLVACRATEGC